MKKLILFLSLCTIARAVGTVQQTTQQVGNTSIYTISLYWTGDAITGTVPVTLVQAQAIPIVQGYRVVTVETVPGSPAPTNNYSVALLDTAGVDVLAGAAANDVSSSNAQSFAGSPTSPPIFGSLSLSITGQSVGGAKGTIFVYLAPFSQVIGLSPTAPSFPAQGANLIYASPNGASGSPGFRALAIPGDLGANTIPIANGGTGSSTQVNALNAILGTSGVTGVQGSGDTKVQMAGTNSGTLGATLCVDANGGATTTGCSQTIPAGTQTQFLEIKPNTGNNTTLQFAGLATSNPNDYNFPAQTPGGSLAIGSNTVTLTPCPLGVNGTDTIHFLYVSGGTGTAEATIITGGTCTSGAATGTVTITAANTHTGAWTIGSATAGAQEAIVAVGSGATLFFAPGTYTMRGTLGVAFSNVRLTGGRGAIIQAATNANLAYVIQTTNAATGFILDNLTLDGNRANNGTAQNPAAAGNAKNLFAVLQVGGAHTTINAAEIRFGQVFGITLQDPTIPPNDFKLYGSYLHDNGGVLTNTGFGQGILMGNPSTTISGVEITSNHFENNYNTVTAPGPSAAIDAFNTNDVQVVGNYAKNNFNVLGGQYVTGSTTGATCSGNDTNWTVVGNTAIMTTQFGGDITFGIEVCGQLQTITGNTLVGNDRGGVLTDAGSTDLTITGNYIDGNGNKETPNLSSGISFGGVGATPALRMVVSGNTLRNYDWGLSNQFATNDFLSLRGNILTSDTTPVIDTSTATHVFISDNLGFNPQTNASGTITVGASPFTYTAAHIPELIAVTGGTVSSIAINGASQAFCSTTPCFFKLEPNETVTVTYTVTPTMVKTIQ